MAKLYFYYGAMGSCKTLLALTTKYNYEERGQKALLLKPKVDNRDGDVIIKSRIGLETNASYIEDIEISQNLKEYDCIIVDEVQFCSPEQINKLSDIVDYLDIPVLCYGLRTDSQSNLFPGSERLLAIADEIEECKTMCWCGHKATFNARYNENGIVRDGEQVVLGANEQYVSLCRKHFKSGMLYPLKKESEN